MLSFGWDISTSIIGMTAFDDDHFLYTNHIDLRKVDGLFEKADFAESQVVKLMKLSEYDCEHHHYIEDRLGGFTGGMSSAQTLMKLAAFNFAISRMIRKVEGAKIQHLHPSTVKAALRKEGLEFPKGCDKKELTLRWVEKRESSFKVDLNKNGNPQPWMYDRADSFVTGLVGIRKHKS